MTPRLHAYKVLWYFAAERQAIFYRRLYRQPPPWTEDWVLRDYKFDNVYRACDRMSQFVINDVVYKRGLSKKPEDVVFRVMLCKLFNRISTYRLLEAHLDLGAKTFDFDQASALLAATQARGEPLFGGAYQLCSAPVFGFKEPFRNYLAMLESTVAQGLSERLQACRSLVAVFDELLALPLLGRFLAYQLSIDLNYTTVLNFDENSFTLAGSGSLRGLDKCFSSLGKRTPEEAIMWLVDHQEVELKSFDHDPEQVWLPDRRLTAIDMEGLLCETDKYLRFTQPGLRSAKTQLRGLFRPSAEPLPYRYPPKWKIGKLHD